MDNLEKSLVAIGVIKKASEYMDAVCRPVLEELGSLASDNVATYRMKNAVKLINRAYEISSEHGLNTANHLSMRLGIEIVSNAALTTDEKLINLWAGLLVSSATDKPNDDNIIYVSRLSRMTGLQAELLEFICKNTKITTSKPNILTGSTVIISIESKFFKDRGFELLDAASDDMRSMEIIEGGIAADSPEFGIRAKPTQLGLSLYAKCMGHKGKLVDYYNVNELKNRTV